MRLSIASIVKTGATVITQLWVIPQNSLFFKIKIKNKKIKAGNMEKADQDCKNRQKSSCNFWWKFKA
jgi:hypothetical protein